MNKSLLIYWSSYVAFKVYLGGLILFCFFRMKWLKFTIQAGKQKSQTLLKLMGSTPRIQQCSETQKKNVWEKMKAQQKKKKKCHFVQLQSPDSHYSSKVRKLHLNRPPRLSFYSTARGTDSAWKHLMKMQYYQKNALHKLNSLQDFLWRTLPAFDTWGHKTFRCSACSRDGPG